MKKSLILVPVLFLFGCQLNSNSELKKNSIYSTCDEYAHREITAALSFMKSEVNFLKEQDLAPTSYRTRQIKNRMSRRLDNMNIRCSSLKCNNSDSIQGHHAYALANPQLTICYRNLKKRGFCNLVETITHEFGHLINVKSDLGHNKGASNDRVYRFGHAIEDRCHEQGLNRPLSRPLDEIEAQQPPRPNGQTVKKVVYDGGDFVHVSGNQWIHHTPQGKESPFIERSRDEWSVFLVRAAKPVNVQLDLHKNQVIFETHADSITEAND